MPVRERHTFDWARVTLANLRQKNTRLHYSVSSSPLERKGYYHDLSRINVPSEITSQSLCDRSQALSAHEVELHVSYISVLPKQDVQTNAPHTCFLFGDAVCSYISIARCILHGSTYQTCRPLAETSPLLHAKLHQAHGTALPTPRFNAVSTADPSVERLFFVREQASLHFTHLPVLKLSHSKTA